MRTEQITFTIPKNKKGLKEELRRMKEEDAVNMSALIVRSLEEKLGHFSIITSLAMDLIIRFVDRSSSSVVVTSLTIST